MSTLEEALQRRRDKQAGIIWASDVSIEQDKTFFLGSGQDASNLEQLQAHQITHILNVADDVPNFHEIERNITYCNLKVGDFGTDAGISRVFDKAILFAQRCQEENGNLLIHCANGSNRSSTITIALFMTLFNMTLKESFCHIKNKHSSTNPLKDNRIELMNWEKESLKLTISTMTEDDF
mmetsp:Transcript_13776/g.16401  ORF Transcript_13776/g.16401 Transcript_13776/m.16401 type:complete len:180 (+) Transcript_13776:17-556(+)